MKSEPNCLGLSTEETFDMLMEYFPEKLWEILIKIANDRFPNQKY